MQYAAENTLQFVDHPECAILVAEAPKWDGSDPNEIYKIGITNESIRARAHRGLRSMLGQMYGVLAPGLITAEHVFQGLKRDMLVRGDRRADIKKLAITWAARRDATLIGDRSAPRVQYRNAPNNTVFVVYVSPNEMLDVFPEIFGWAEHWTWVAADPNVSGAPIDWNERYDERLWSRAGLSAEQ